MVRQKGRFGFDTYLSVFTWRYGSKEMRDVFSEMATRQAWRNLWVKLAAAQASFGLVSKQEVQDLKTKSEREFIDISRAHEIEKRIRHDLMAEVHVYARQARKGGGKLHLGATSADIEDNVDIMRFHQALNIILKRVVSCLAAASESVRKYKGLVCMGWTHLQPAEPTTLGYRLASYAQDLVLDVALLEDLLRHVKGKGLKGAVGTSASYQRLLEGRGRPAELERKLMGGLGLDYFPVSTQTYPRKVDYLILATLASIAQSCHKFGFDLRVLQSPAFGELSEPIGEEQVGSSAMPFKRNPVAAERMCSLARFVGTLPHIGFMNAATSLLERTLDDSASRRIVLPEAFLAVDECLRLYERLMKGLRVYRGMIARNLERYGAFAGTEPLLMKLVEKGESRQAMHEVIRRASFYAWEQVMEGKPNPLPQLLKKDRRISSKMRVVELEHMLDPRHHIGDVEERSARFIEEVVAPILSRYRDMLGAEAGVQF